ncbi:glycosyltransferase [Thalassospira lucentensis]|uniref:glycosyltransferase n=1 Tax=Thalassospira lucentensis TaxID=168935 RepID=UPI00142D3521|nr:glycosyltransferase [Thalassospira lucentensis]NIZ00161.1 glycosyltransferase [Thalassospira lucentensis]
MISPSNTSDTANAVNPLVSVIMANFNGGIYLKDCVESVLNQTYDNLEFIIVDDCSTDESFEYLDNIDDKRIVLIKNASNIGQTKSLNKAISKSSGQYLARMDSDDICYPERLFEQVRFFEQNPEISILGAQATIIDHNGKLIGQTFLPKESVSIWAFCFFSNPFVHPSIMIRRTILPANKMLYSDQYINQDFELWSRILTRSNAANLPRQLLYYRQHPSNMTTRHYHENLKNTCNIIRERFAREGSTSVEFSNIIPIITYVFGDRREADAQNINRAFLGHQLLDMVNKLGGERNQLSEFHALIIYRILQSCIYPRGFDSIFCRIHLFARAFKLNPKETIKTLKYFIKKILKNLPLKEG